MEEKQIKQGMERAPEEGVRAQPTAAEIYAEYQKGVDYLNRFGLYSKLEEAYRMFIGDQWHGLNAGGERLPIFNIIQPVVEFKVASVASNQMSINYAPLGVSREKRPAYDGACQLLTRYAAQQWEQLKMDAACWRLLEDACIGGAGYLYFYVEQPAAAAAEEAELKLTMQSVDAVSVHFANEQDADIQSQPYIIIAERRPVADLRAQARANGLEEGELAAIVADSETEHVLGDAAKQEIEGRAGDKCLSLLKMWKEADGLHWCRSTREVVYQPEQAAPGLQLYPLASLIWLKQKSSARGMGEVLPIVPNQIEINKNLARRIMNAKLSAFNRLVYNAQMIPDAAALDQVGSVIRVDGPVAKVQEAITYLAPQSMSPDVQALSEELMSVTKELTGAGDAALGNINPEKASGAAIIAVRDQAALPLNKQVADFRQFVEDVAAIWYALWAAYHPNGLSVELEEDGQELLGLIPAGVLEQMRVHIRIDVSPSSPITKYAQEQALENLFVKGDLSFEEYVSCLDEDSTVPKAKLQEVIERRQALQAQQAAMQQLLQQQAMPQQQNMQQQAAQIPGLQQTTAPGGTGLQPSLALLGQGG